MSAESTYLDASAFLKLTLTEAETAALRLYLSPPRPWVSSALLRTEAVRAVRRSGGELLADVRSHLREMTLVPVDDDLLEVAGSLPPAELRTLDALHLATALRLGTDLAAIVTYDARMAAAAASLGLTVAAPS